MIRSLLYYSTKNHLEIKEMDDTPSSVSTGYITSARIQNGGNATFKTTLTVSPRKPTESTNKSMNNKTILQYKWFLQYKDIIVWLSDIPYL